MKLVCERCGPIRYGYQAAGATQRPAPGHFAFCAGCGLLYILEPGLIWRRATPADLWGRDMRELEQLLAVAKQVRGPDGPVN